VGGVSEKMLAQTLQILERDGFVHRDAKPVIPPRVDYSLTPLGREVAEQVSALARWLESKLDDVVAAREAYDGLRKSA
jgi:DNA-binding HxlR family transcriptional regulator